MTADVVEVVPAGPLSGAVAAPASKSVTNRLLLIAALAEGRSRLGAPLASDDSAAMRDVVTGLGATVGEEGRSWVVTGVAGRPAVPAGPLDCRLSGTTMRFGVAAAALAPAPVTLTGAPSLLGRPIGPLTAALRALGADVADADGFPPVTVGGGLTGGEVTVDVTGSSQFASAVLLAAPYAAADVTVLVTGEDYASAYVDLTVAAMAEWGADVRTVPGGWTVTAGRGYVGRDVLVEYDASAAAHLFGLAVATGGTVTVTNALPSSLQPDAAFPTVLERLGATVTRDGDAVTVTGPSAVQPAGDVDLTAMPDQVTTLAALAALAPGRTTITGVAVARGHETDRVAALAAELAKVGAAVEELPDGLVVDGTPARGRATLDTHDDHRLAMAFAALAARLPGVRIADPGCVAKTYPAFWDDLRALGGQVRAA